MFKLMKKTIEVKKIDEQFLVFVDDVETGIGCEKCMYDSKRDDMDCSMAKTSDGEYRDDELMYPFCGIVCGYFDLDIS